MSNISPCFLIRVALSVVFGGLALVFAGLSSVNAEAASVHDLRVEHLVNPLGVASATPRFSWKIVSDKQGDKQTAYQIVVKGLDGVEWDSGKVKSVENVLVPYGGGALPRGAFATWKVRVWDKDSAPSGWSRPATFSVGLLSESDWVGEYIGAPVVKEKGRSNPTSILLRKEFEAAAPESSIFAHINSLGYHELYLNGFKVAPEEVLAPAVSQFNKRSLSRVYLLKEHLRPGKNEIVIWLGQGWYRQGFPGNAYPSPLVRAQVEAYKGKTWKTLVKTDATWMFLNSAYNDTNNWRWDTFGGEVLDARKLPETSSVYNEKYPYCWQFSHTAFSKLNWKPAVAVAVPVRATTPQSVEGNIVAFENKRNAREAAILPVKIDPAGENKWLLDFGTTLTGWLQIEFPKLDEGQEIVIEYTDHLGSKNSFVNQKQSDRYIASGREGEIFLNKFNYHCFRYVRISNLKRPPDAKKTRAFFIQTNYKDATSFECSDADLNAIHNMVKRTLRALSLGGYLVDCTHFERLGYGGDGNASTRTFQTMFDVAPLYKNWLQAWRDVQFPDGRLPYTAPSPIEAGGGPYWCAFVVSAPWSTYVQYGDKTFLEESYSTMQKWIGYTDKFTHDGVMKQWRDPRWRRLWYLGDWAVPKGMKQNYERMLGQSVELVNNCVMADVFEKMRRIATVLNKPADAKKYAVLADERRAKIHERFYDKEKQNYGGGLQLDFVYPLLIGATPPQARAAVLESLKKTVAERDNGHLVTGLVGVPIITEWAIENKQVDFLYNMLKKRAYPGYLYMMDQGATATWEHWNGERSRLHNCYNGIGSWFYEAIGGIRPDESAPGWKKFFVEPQIPKGVTWAKVTKETPHGTVKVEWKIEGGKTLKISLVVPVGATALVVGKNGKIAEHASGTHEINMPLPVY
ncbi:MAG: glycoside hydrolase family 78 protein [Puniceicoccales bacterium]|jgi:alpha-L-rhamnosidase|nr:glycoside hydrolase family 78 protein [Puniceicoccales bacterium]